MPREQTFMLSTEYIELQQLLKAMDFIGSGSEAKIYLQEHEVFVSGVQDQRRGRKLRPGDVVVIDGKWSIKLT